MSLRFVLGLPGTGKTSLCLDEIAERLSGEKALYYLVPEQFSLQSEKLLVRRAPSYTRAQVLSFNRLAYQLFARLGAPPGKLMDELGRNMLLRKILYDCGGRLAYYGRSADKQGFVDNLARTITELNHYNITADDLLARAEAAASGAPGTPVAPVAPVAPGLAAKLTDLALILRKYREAVTGRFLPADDTLSLLAQKLNTATPLHDTLFWVDGFTGFTPQERQVLGHILRTAERVTVALTRRPSFDKPDPLYEMTRDTQYVLTELAHSLGVKVEKPVVLETDYRHGGGTALAFFAARYDLTGPPDTYPAPQHAVTVVSAPDRYAQVYETARRIGQLVAEEGYRYRDIAVLTGDRDGYEKILRNTFGRLRIPLFIDSKTDILPHPLTELIRAAVDVAAHNWPYESVFRFLKTRLTNLTADEIDILENYVLAHGINSFRWRYAFPPETRGGEAAQPDQPAPVAPVAPAEAARQRVLAALSPFTDGLYPDKKETVRAFTHRVYGLLTALNVTDKLSAWFDERTQAGDHETARTHRQIWPKLCEIFDKLAEILGDDTVTLREYAKILDAGLAQADLGLIPPSVDQVLLGDIGRSRFPELRALFVLGANDGKLPPPVESAGLFTDEERARLRDGALELAPDRVKRVNESWFSLYCALCQPRDTLVFLYASGETDGKALRPAKLLSRLKEMYPALTEERAPAFSEYPAPAAPDASARAVDLSILSDAPGMRLSRETARRLYGTEVVTGASRLEQYAECPFAYFVTYNLKAKERKIYTVQPADLGVVFHEVLALFSRRLTEDERGWDTLDKPEIDRRVRGCVAELIPEEGEINGSAVHVLKSTARNRYILEKVRRICTTSVWALAEHIKRGTFIPAGYELAFQPGTPVTTLEIRLNNERKLILTGRIDRVDILRADGGVCYVKIIDYKSGKKRFDLGEALLGTQVQLLLYMNALLKNGEALFGGGSVAWEARPGGVFYFHIDDPVLPADGELDPERLETLLLRYFRMSGLALAETEAVAGMDVSLPENGGESLIIPVSLNKNGLFGKRSSVAALEEFEQIGSAVEDKIKEIGLAMTEGVITPDPYKPKACEYCHYGAICNKR